MIAVDKNPPSMFNNIGPIMQIGFEMTEGVRLTALVNAGSTTSMDSPHPATGNHWKKGDKVLIASVPGRKIGSGATHTVPGATYFVIDHRSADRTE